MSEEDVIRGPVDYLVVGFPGNRFNGEILPELGLLIASGTVRVLDLAFVSKDAEGTITIGEIEDLPDDLAGAWKGLSEFLDGIVDEAELLEAAEELEPESSAAIIVWENLWAVPFIEALAGSSAVLIGSGRLPSSELIERLAE